MADNFQVTAGSGTTIGAKDVGSGVLHQRIIPTHNSAGTDTTDSTPFPVKPMPVTSGGCDVYRNLDQDETGTNPKGSAGQVYGGICYNTNASVRYLKIYNKATAPTSSDTPILTIPLAAGLNNLNFPVTGVPFSSGIGLRATTDLADNGTGAPGTNEVIVNLFYK